MKFKFILITLIIAISTGCSVDSSTNEQIPTISLWHMVKVEGGVAGINETYATGTIIWFFNGDTIMLEVENNNTDDAKQDGLDTGDYSYSFEVVNQKEYISINDNEWGRIYFVNQNTLVIDENDKSDGTGADGFQYTFARQLVAE